MHHRLSTVLAPGQRVYLMKGEMHLTFLFGFKVESKPNSSGSFACVQIVASLGHEGKRALQTSPPIAFESQSRGAGYGLRESRNERRFAWVREALVGILPKSPHLHEAVEARTSRPRSRVVSTEESAPSRLGSRAIDLPSISTSEIFPRRTRNLREPSRWGRVVEFAFSVWRHAAPTESQFVG